MQFATTPAAPSKVAPALAAGAKQLRAASSEVEQLYYGIGGMEPEGRVEAQTKVLAGISRQVEKGMRLIDQGAGPLLNASGGEGPHASAAYELFRAANDIRFDQTVEGLLEQAGREFHVDTAAWYRSIAGGARDSLLRTAQLADEIREIVTD